MKKDVIEYAKKSDACQRHRYILQQLLEPLHHVKTPWTFINWGMDIAGKLLIAASSKVFILAMTDYFSKWIEVEAFV